MNKLNNKIIIIVGPTASKKSKLAIDLATDLNLEIINADAYQVYKEINVGINKPSEEQLKKIKHHLINNVSIHEEWNIKIFQDCFYKILKDNPNKNFIVCGGSNLYIDAIIKNYNLNQLDKSINFDNWTNVDLWNKLNELDKLEAKKININNTKRLQQALRIIYSNNQKKSEKDLNNNDVYFNYLLISTKINREVLYNKINVRAIKMINNGWKKEVENLINKYGNDVMNLNGLKAIGYNLVFDSIINNSEIDIEKIKQKTRQYAKRQITWINNKFNIDHWFDFDNQNYDEILNCCKRFLNE